MKTLPAVTALIAALTVAPVAVAQDGAAPSTRNAPPVADIRARAEAGDAEAQAWFGDYHAYGYKHYLQFPETAPADYPDYAANTGARSLDTAIAWYEKAAAQGQPDALYILPVLYGMESPRQDLKAMEAWLARVAYGPATKGAAREIALSELCWYYDRGYFGRRSPMGYPIAAGVEVAPNPVAALSCLKKAHAISRAPLMQEEIYRLARFQETGRGAPRDLDAAEALYRELLAMDVWLAEDNIVGLAGMRLGLLLQAKGDFQGAYLWLFPATDGQRCPDMRWEDDASGLCNRAAVARGEVAAQLTPDERTRIEAAAPARVR